MAGVLNWIGDHWQPIIAAWGAVLSTVLAARTWWRERSRVHFWVGVGRAGVDAGGNIILAHGRPGQGYSLEGGVTTVVIGVYNRSRDPLHLHRVGLRGTGTARMVFFQSPGFQELPVKLEPTDGFTMASKLESVAQALPAEVGAVRHIKGPFCTDGAGREYGRRLRRDERDGLVEALGRLQMPVAQEQP